MNVPGWLKPGLYGAAVGGIVLASVGFARAGWATMPGATAPDRDLANACVTSLAAQF